MNRNGHLRYPFENCQSAYVILRLALLSAHRFAADARFVQGMSSMPIIRHSTVVSQHLAFHPVLRVRPTLGHGHCSTKGSRLFFRGVQ
jgi:hypothetical protein